MSRLFAADAHRGDGQRFVVRADEKLTAFLERERVMRRRNVLNLQGIEQQSRSSWRRFLIIPI